MGQSRIRQLLSTKQAQLALRFFTYGVMAVSTVLLTVMAIFYAMGYRFNQASLAVEQGGLVQLRSAPSGAAVIVDGKEKNDLKTPSRAYLGAGSHSVEMRLDGYEPWRRSFDLQAGQLLWLDYVRLLPTQIKTESRQSFPSVAEAMFSPDRRWLILNETAEMPMFKIYDLSNPAVVTEATATIPQDQLTVDSTKPSRFSIIEWDFGSHSVLVRHDMGDVSEVLRIDRTRLDQAVNISKLFGLKIGEVHFAGGNQSVVYAQTGDNVLRRLDIDSSTASAALVTGVKHFVVYGEDRIAFVADTQTTTENGQVAHQVVGTYENGKEVVAREYGTEANIGIDLTEYFRHQYLAIATGGSQVEVLRDPTEKALETPTYVKFDATNDVMWLKFSSNGRMIAAGGGNAFATYDLEVGQEYDSLLDGLEITRPLKWVDDYYLWTDAGDSLTLVEFDGQNRRNIGKVASGYAASISQNGEVLFDFVRSDSGIGLQSNALVVQ